MGKDQFSIEANEPEWFQQVSSFCGSVWRISELSESGESRDDVHGAGRKYGEYRSTHHTAIESIFGSFVNSKTEDTLQKIVLRFSELVVKAIDNSRRTDVEDALVKDGKSKIETMNFKTGLIAQPSSLATPFGM